VNHLRRDLAPIFESAWTEIQQEANDSLANYLAGRRLIEFDGPKGWTTASVATGRISKIESASEGVIASVRDVRPMIELRADFTLQRSEIDAIDRGATDPDLDPLVTAARAIAIAEDKLIFEGAPEHGVTGMAAGSEHKPVKIQGDYADFPTLVAQAVGKLREAGVDGPYGLALGPRCYTGVTETSERGGYPVLEHLKLIAGGPVVWAPGMDGSLVMSLRGGDFRLTVGQDFSIGYRSHDAETVTLYLEESVTFSNDSPEAAIALRYT
jgi:uncharacterized linocin/CFP29 family protein